MSEPAPLACARVRVLLEAFVDGDLARSDPAAAASVHAHLATCTDCRRQHHEATSLPFRLRALASPAPPASLLSGVMRAVTPSNRQSSRRAWALLAPEAALVAFIVWYVSGPDGLVSLASGIFNDLQTLAGWGAGASSLPSVPGVDVLLLAALIALAGTAAYHLSILIRLDSGSEPSGVRGVPRDRPA